MLYQGDDLVNLMHIRVVSRDGSELPELEAIEVTIGKLKKRYEKPSNPFVVNIMRDESVYLSTVNKCFACIWYYGEVNGERKLLKQTCDGDFVLNLKPEVICNARCKK